MSELKKDGIRAAMSEQVERDTLKKMAQQAGTDNEQTLEPCPLPEPLRPLAQEFCFECRTGTVINGRGAEHVYAPHRSHEPRGDGANWFHKLRGGTGIGYGCGASALYELNTRVSAASTAPVVDELKLNNDEIGALINYNLRKLGEAPCKESARVFRTRVERLRAIYEN